MWAFVLARPERLDGSYAASSPLRGSACRNASRSSDRTLEFECYPELKKKKGPRWGPFIFFGAPGEIRTPDRSVRSRVLYPAELRALGLVVAAMGRSYNIIMAEREGFEPSKGY